MPEQNLRNIADLLETFHQLLDEKDVELSKGTSTYEKRAVLLKIRSDRDRIQQEMSQLRKILA